MLLKRSVNAGSKEPFTRSWMNECHLIQAERRKIGNTAFRGIGYLYALLEF